MNALEKRDKLSNPTKQESWGECFVAVRQGDQVRTLSGIALSFDLENEVERHMEDNYYSFAPTGNITLTIHFGSDVVMELRPFDGSVSE